MTYLSDEQVAQLLRPINPKRVGSRDGMSHLEAYDVRAHLDRIFGFARWSSDVLDVTKLYEEQTTTKAGKPAYAVAYRATVRLTVCAPDGTVLATYTECATGDGVMPDFKRSDAHDFAIKTAESQALKRCATNLGDQFGLSLYRKGSLAALVGRVLWPDTDTSAESDVTAHISEQLPAEDAPDEVESSSEVNTPAQQANAPLSDAAEAAVGAADKLVERILAPVPKGVQANVHYAALQAEAAKIGGLNFPVNVGEGPPITVKALIDRRLLQARKAKA